VVRQSIRPENCPVEGNFLAVYYLIAMPDVRKVKEKRINWELLDVHNIM